MITKAQARFIRITPRKFRQIIPLIKGRNPEEAIDILANVKKKASVYAIELLKSAVANAKRIQGVDPSNLYISRIIANCGPVLKRYRAASMGRAVMVKKRTSHIIIELDELKKPKEKVIPPKPDSKQKMAGSRNELQKVRRRREKAKG